MTSLIPFERVYLFFIESKLKTYQLYIMNRIGKKNQVELEVHLGNTYTVFTMKCEFIGMGFAAFMTYCILKNTFKFAYCQEHLHFLSL